MCTKGPPVLWLISRLGFQVLVWREQAGLDPQRTIPEHEDEQGNLERAASSRKAKTPTLHPTLTNNHPEPSKTETKKRTEDETRKSKSALGTYWWS